MSRKITILFPLDFSEHSDCAFPMAQFVAKTYDADIHVLHVLEAPTGPIRMISGFDEDAARKKALQMMDEYIKINGDSSITFHKLIKVGKPWKTIVEAATEMTVNAIVMGTHGADGISELFVGTNAGRVITHAPCPVITLRNKPATPGFTKIMLPLDLTMETGEKLELGIEFAKNFNTSLFVLGVAEASDEDTRKRMQKRIDLAVAHIRKHEVAVQSDMIVAKLRVADQIIAAAKAAGVDLICIMTQQSESNIKETLLGSNSVHVVNHSDIPILAIKPKREYRSHTFAGSHFG